MYKMNKKKRMSSNRSFGFVFFVVFLILAFWPIKSGGDIIIWSIIVSSFFFILAVINSKILTPFNRLWTKFGFALGAVIAPIVMGIIFFVIITPIGLTMRLMGKDVLMKKYSEKLSYWIERDKNIGTMKKQF